MRSFLQHALECKASKALTPLQRHWRASHGYAYNPMARRVSSSIVEEPMGGGTVKRCERKSAKGQVTSHPYRPCAVGALWVVLL